MNKTLKLILFIIGSLMAWSTIVLAVIIMATFRVHVYICYIVTLFAISLMASLNINMYEKIFNRRVA